MTETINSSQAAKKIVHLTPDDIITLRLCMESTLGNVNPHRTNEDARLLETLERILKQVG